MIEVFKTNVNKPAQAEQLVQLIQQTFAGYNANFDLEDCDRILRIKSRTLINSGEVIRLLSRMDITYRFWMKRLHLRRVKRPNKSAEPESVLKIAAILLFHMNFLREEIRLKTKKLPF